MSESKKITGSDLIAPDYLKDAIAQAEHFLKVIKETKQVILDTNKATSAKLKDATKKTTGAGGSNSTAAKDLKEANALLNESIKQRKLATAAEVAELKATLDLEKAKKAQADFDKKQLAEEQKKIKVIEQQNSAYAKASKNLNELRKQYRDLAIAGKGAEQESQQMLKAIQQLDKELKEVDASMGQFQRSVGDYKNQVHAAIAETGVFNEGLGKMDEQQKILIEGFKGLTEQFKHLTAAEEGAAKSAGKLDKILRLSIVGILVTVGTALFSFFTGSRRGMLEFDLIMNKIKGTIDIFGASLKKIGAAIVEAKDTFFLLAKMTNPITGLIALFRGEISIDAFKKAFEDIGNVVSETTDAFDDNMKKIEEQQKEYDALTKEIYAFEDAVLKLNITLEQARMDEEDYNEIQNDTTITLTQQKKALENAIKSRKQAAQIAKDVADKEYDISVKKIKLQLRSNGVNEEGIAILEKQGYQAFLNSKHTLDVLPDELHAIQEKYLAQLHANDALDDLQRQEAERRRKIIQDEVIEEVELIRSKKLGADAAVQLLNEQIQDEKNQLEERQQFEEQLRAKQLEAQKEEVTQLAKFKVAAYTKEGKMIEQLGITEQQINDLIAEKDAVALAKKIKATNLSVIQQEELAKVILEAQNSEIAYQKQLAKFEDERIKREQTILRLNQEIAIINEHTVLDHVQSIEQQKQQILQESNDKILQNENVFNRKMVAQRRDAAFAAEAIVVEDFAIRRDLLEKQYELDKQNIENTVNDEKIKQKELEKLQANYYANQQKLQQEEMDKTTAMRKQEAEELRKIEIRKTEIIVDALQKATQALQQELQNRQAIQAANVQRQLDKTNQELERQRDLANKGLANTLAYQEHLMEKEQLRQQDLQKRQQKQQQAVQLAEALLNAYNSELKQPDATPTTAAGKALADVLIFKALAAGLVQFAAEGNDDVQGPGTTTSDSIPFMLSKHEGVVKADANMNNPGVVAALNSDKFDQLYVPRYNLTDDISGSTAHNIASSLLLQKNEEIISLLRDIKSKPIQQVDVDGMMNIIETVYMDGVKKVTTLKNKRSRI